MREEDKETITEETLVVSLSVTYLQDGEERLEGVGLM